MKAELQETAEDSPLNWGVWVSASTVVLLGAGRAGQDILALISPFSTCCHTGHLTCVLVLASQTAPRLWATFSPLLSQ